MLHDEANTNRFTPRASAGRGGRWHRWLIANVNALSTSPSGSFDSAARCTTASIPSRCPPGSRDFHPSSGPGAGAPGRTLRRARCRGPLHVARLLEPRVRRLRHIRSRRSGGRSFTHYRAGRWKPEAAAHRFGRRPKIEDQRPRPSRAHVAHLDDIVRETRQIRMRRKSRAVVPVEASSISFADAVDEVTEIHRPEVDAVPGRPEVFGTVECN